MGMGHVWQIGNDSRPLAFFEDLLDRKRCDGEHYNESNEKKDASSGGECDIEAFTGR